MSYRAGHKDEAAFKYLFLAELGYEPAQTNFAYIIDQGKVYLYKVIFIDIQNILPDHLEILWKFFFIFRHVFR